MVTGPNSTENTCPFQEEGTVAQQGKIASKGDQAPARKTPNPIFQCLIFRLIMKSYGFQRAWVALISSSVPFNTHSLSPEPVPTHAYSFFVENPTVLASSHPVLSIQLRFRHDLRNQPASVSLYRDSHPHIQQLPMFQDTQEFILVTSLIPAKVVPHERTSNFCC